MSGSADPSDRGDALAAPAVPLVEPPARGPLATEPTALDAEADASDRLEHSFLRWACEEPSRFGLVRPDLPDSTVLAFRAMAGALRHAAPWRFSGAAQLLRITGVEAAPVWLSMHGAGSRPAGVSIVYREPEASSSTRVIATSHEWSAAAEVLHVLFPPSPARTDDASVEATLASGSEVLAVNARRSGADALLTRAEMLICINALRMLSLVPLEAGIPFTKRFVNRNGSEAFATWPHPLHLAFLPSK